MSNRESGYPKAAPPSISTLRMIVTAIVLGSCVVGGAVLFSASRIGGRILPDPIIGYVVAIVAVQALVLQAIAPRFFSRPLASDSESTLLAKFGTLTLIRVSILEAAAVLCFVIYLLTLNELVLVAGVVLVLAIVLLRPSDTSYTRWRSAAAND
jgi:DMSO reductase anchor subunit